jgi:hypothetical protein
MHPGSVCCLVYVMTAAHHGAPWVRSPVDMGALHRCPLRHMIVGAVHRWPIIDPIGDWHRSHDELALIHPEYADVSGDQCSNPASPIDPHRSRTLGVW